MESDFARKGIRNGLDNPSASRVLPLPSPKDPAFSRWRDKSEVSESKILSNPESHHFLTECELPEIHLICDSAIGNLRGPGQFPERFTWKSFSSRHEKYLSMINNWRGIKNARHDTGAERGNFIDKNLADNLDLQIRQGKKWQIRQDKSDCPAPSPWQDHVRKFCEMLGINRSTPKRTATSEVLQEHSAGRYLPMIINGREIKDARHDTGAERGNFIDKNLADNLDLQIRQGKSDCKSFSLGNGKVVRSVGKVKAVCAFAKETQTRVKCCFYVFNKLAAPLIMGSEFLEKTKTMSVFTNRLEDRPPCLKSMPMLNFVGSTPALKRRFAAFIDGRQTYINADSGSELDVMASSYVRDHGYKIDRRRECRKRIQVADSTIVESIGQVSATLTLNNGRSYLKLFDVLPGLTSDVLLGEASLEEISAFTLHESSFVEVSAGERHNELCTLGYLGRVNDFLARHLRRSKRGPDAQAQPSLAKQQDDAMMENLHAEDLEARRVRLERNNLPAQERLQPNGGGERQRQDTSHVLLQRQHATTPPILQRSTERSQVMPRSREGGRI